MFGKSTLNILSPIAHSCHDGAGGGRLSREYFGAGGGRLYPCEGAGGGQIYDGMGGGR